MASFDPYHIWLGIPPEDQPPSHYQLLGITPFESNPDVIEMAAEQRTLLLRTLQSGPDVQLAEQLLNEVSAARIQLLNSDKKASYDWQLQAAMQPAPVPTPAPLQNDPLGIGGLLPNAAVPQPSQVTEAAQPIWQKPLVLVATGSFVAVIVLLVVLNSGDDNLIQETRKSATVLGRVTYADGRFDIADPGAVVIVLPRGTFPSEKLPIDSLKPEDEPISGDDPIVKEIRMMGGDIARTGSNGQFRLRVPNGGSFYLLTISNNRPRKGKINVTHLDEISRYFQGTSELIGNQSYRWTRESLQATQKIGILFP